MENNWKLVTTKHYYDAEANLAILFCKGLGIDLHVSYTDYPELIRQGSLPLLIIGPKIFQKGEIAKYLVNLVLRNEKENYEQLFNVFDNCYQILGILDYFMWAANSKILYGYRDVYTFLNPINKFQQISNLIGQKKRFKKMGYTDLEKITQKAKIHLTIIQHWIKIQQDEQKPISIYYILCFVILKSISYNLRYSPIFGTLIKTDLKDYLYQINQKLSGEFQLQQIEGIQQIISNYNARLNQLIKMQANQKEKESKHKIILQIISLSLFSYAIYNSDFK